MPGSTEKRVRDAPLLVRLQIVHVRAVAVGFLADAVAGAMDEGLSIARGVDDGTCGLVDLPSFERPIGGY